MIARASVTGSLPWPQWAYVPGETDLDADCEMLDVAKATVPSAFRGYVPAQHPALRYRLELGSHVGGGPPAAPSAP